MKRFTNEGGIFTMTPLALESNGSRKPNLSADAEERVFRRVQRQSKDPTELLGNM